MQAKMEKAVSKMRHLPLLKRSSENRRKRYEFIVDAFITITVPTSVALAAGEQKKLYAL